MMSALDSMPCVRRETVLGASVALYVISLLMPVMYFEKDASLTGMSVLAQGWWGLLMLNPSWLANPLYTIAAVQFARSRYRRASIFSGAAVACAICSFFTTKWYFNEADATPIASFGIAFYTWLVAQIVLLFGSLRLRQEAAGAGTS
ncbi:hypothetical protein WJ47_17085 [Burkholderia ubonensis]|uniref:Integral membrane protein n=1 Tax=Burkholderia ubonensis TaxID=101571 RepID=A0AB73FZR6_9BURK|nr:hypothetical protein [Burkholderia ubonensis]KVK78138.1 hypothetical protein WJ44_15185 [Burkholderia ubonensis]KVL61825.1 hypothetical protein WJ47_17085 [Burkholderia ubonensis]KVM28603.1 hypothetical protein WJ53_09075 [Burkholderia ubonensis]KVM35114.1 hypothetical protein WJ54_36065 [Burkholderia ubonensis]